MTGRDDSGGIEGRHRLKLDGRLCKAVGIALCLSVTGLSCYIFFWHLGDEPIRQWDEASIAVNSFEMLVRGTPFAKYFGGELDFINTKPPLMNWLVAGSMALFGPGSFALRLPSAIAGFVTVLVTWLFTARALGDRIAAFAAVMVLMTSVGFIGEHVARGGDYDSLLVLFLTIFALGAFRFAQTAARRDLVIAAGGLGAALITKGVAAALPVPGVFLYFLLGSTRRQLLMRKDTILAAMLALLPLAIVYGLTELAQPGYLAAVAENELWGRFGKLVEGGTPRGGFYYLHALYDYRFRPWLLLLPFCFFIREKFVSFSCLYLVGFLLIISISETKFHWYDAAFYPVASICVGLLIGRAFRYMSKGAAGPIVAAVLVSVLFAYPLRRIMTKELVNGRLLFRENDAKIALSAEEYRAFLEQVLATGRIKAAERLALANSFRYNTPLLFVRDVTSHKWRRPIELRWDLPMDHPPKAAWLISCGPDLDAPLVEGGLKKIMSNARCSLWRAAKMSPPVDRGKNVGAA